MKNACSVPLMIRGDVVSFEMKNGDVVELPGDWGIIHDPLGECIPRCELMLAPYRVVRRNASKLPQELADAASDYFGDKTPLYQADIDLPAGPWDRVGRVVRIYYDRYGDLEGPYQHPFKQPVLLSRQKRAQVFPGGHKVRAYKLSLPNECVIDEHGFVWP